MSRAVFLFRHSMLIVMCDTAVDRAMLSFKRRLGEWVTPGNG